MKFDLLFAEIIIAESDGELSRRMHVVMQSAGYSVRTVSNSSALFETVRKRQPNLLLLGAGLNDGFDVIRSLKADASLPFIPVIFIAKSAERTPIAAALNAGADDFILTPIDHAELLMRARSMLRLKASSDKLAELNATLEQKVIERTQQLEKVYDQMRHAEKLASLGRLAASIAHEINNPLAAILTYLDLIKMQLSPDSPVREDVQIVEHQVNAIGRLVRDLRDFSKPPRKDRAPVLLNSVVENVLLLTGKDLEHRKIRVERDLDASLPPVLASSEQIGEILLNLVMNARDAMPQGGALRIRTNSSDQCSRVQVSDTGSGIEPDALERIFEPFFTTKGEHGTGLGLSIAYSIVQDHGGYLKVQSVPAQGTTFTLGLPGMEKAQEGISCQECSLRELCMAGGG